MNRYLSSAVGTHSGPAGSPRFYCSECSRGYSAIGKLNRYCKNHSSSNKHVCRFCQTGFKRKDLLDRHLQIHKRGSSRRASKPCRDSRPCVRCSQRRVRCDRMIPCSGCARGNHSCQY
ncbi:uncharacterized protein BDZ99DRAFT_428402, partial [Mytilinidion resinicola]